MIFLQILLYACAACDDESINTFKYRFVLSMSLVLYVVYPKYVLHIRVALSFPSLCGFM